MILKGLRHLGFKVTPESKPAVLLGPLDYDYIFAMHLKSSYDGHELLGAAIAAQRGIPFMGAPAPIRAMAEDKVLGKHVAASIGLDVVEHHLIDPLRPETTEFLPPGRWVVKPRGGCDSIAIMLVEGEVAWRDVFVEIADPKYEGRQFIAERFVPGLNLTVPVIEGFPTRSFDVFLEKGRPSDNILDHASKIGQTPGYESDPYFGPGSMEASAAAAKMAAAIAPFDYARFDFRFDPESNRLVYLEANIVCALAPAAVVARAAEDKGITYPSLIGHIVTHSLRRQASRVLVSKSG